MQALFRVFALALIGIGLAATASLGVASARPKETGRPRYIASGDSVGFGRRASDPATTGYVPQLAGDLATVIAPGNAPSMPAKAQGSFFGYRNTSRIGDETTTDMVAAGGQLGEIVGALQQHNQNPSPMDDVQVITLSIGANDMRALLSNPACATNPFGNVCQAAITQTLSTVAANLHLILGTLRAEAGPDTVIAIMTYYNPFQGQCTAAVPPPLLGVIPLVLGALNQQIVLAAGAYDVIVAPVAQAGLGPSDLYGDCIHPNDSGYAKIADTFWAAIEDELQ